MEGCEALEAVPAAGKRRVQLIVCPRHAPMHTRCRVFGGQSLRISIDQGARLVGQVQQTGFESTAVLKLATPFESEGSLIG